MLNENELNENEKIKGLAEMQAHCGFAGLVLTGTWLILIHFFTPVNVRELPGTSLVFFILLGCGFFSPIYFLRLVTIKAIEANNFFKARGYLRFSSVICIICISALIYASGGANSPFIVFYTMTFTLTLSQLKSKNFELVSFVIFLIPLALVFFLVYNSFFREGYTLGAVLPIDSMKGILGQPFHFIMQSFATCIALLVPTISIISIRVKLKHPQTV